jgi:hypothetical protein
MFFPGRRKRTGLPGTFDTLDVAYDSRGRPFQVEHGGGPGIGPNLKANAGPDRRANYVGNSTVLSPEGAKAPPPVVNPTPLPHPPAHVRIPSMTLHPYAILPYHGAVELVLPQPAAWIDPGLWNIDPQRIDWRRPDAVLPGTVEP